MPPDPVDLSFSNWRCLVRVEYCHLGGPGCTEFQAACHSFLALSIFRDSVSWLCFRIFTILDAGTDLRLSTAVPAAATLFKNHKLT